MHLESLETLGYLGAQRSSGVIGYYWVFKIGQCLAIKVCEEKIETGGTPRATFG